MIHIALDTKAILPFVDYIADKILAPCIADVFAKHPVTGPDPLLSYEVDFYMELLKHSRLLLRMKPSSIEWLFKRWLIKHEDYLVLASGSLKKFQRHLDRASGPKQYHAQWAIHQNTIGTKGSAKTCKCDFCKVSARAAEVFNWKKFSKRDTHNRSMAADFVRAIGFVVCPYCSRNYISPIQDTGGEVYRPDLDHYFAKSIYPYFGLCLYNLVPSCAACNCRIKRDADFLHTGYFHPYRDKVPEALFSLEGKPIYDGSKIDVSSVRVKLNATGCTKTRKSAKFFKLATAYGVHAVEIANFVASLRNFPDKLIEERAKELGADEATLKLMLNRSPLEDESVFKTRPLGKLYRDLYQFGLKGGFK